MAAKTTVRVAVTNNAAKDDSFGVGNYSWLSEDGSLKGDLNVLANDPGSAKLLGVSDVMPTTQAELTNGVDHITVNANGTNYDITIGVNADGTVNFDASKLMGHLDYLAEGETLNVDFYYTAQMANGAYSTSKVSISIDGNNDIASISGDHDGSIVEDTKLVASGTLTVVDADHDQSHTQVVVASAHNSDMGLGSRSTDADGHWNYTVDNTLIQHLGAGVHASDTFTVTSLDGSASKQVVIDIVGVNDTATIDGTTAGSITEDSQLTAGGTLTVHDVDDGEAHTQVVVASAHNSDMGLGSRSTDADGHWNYTVDNTLIQHLGAGVHASDTFTVTSLDGSASKQVVIDIVGVNDTATIDGTTAGSITEDSQLTAGGTLTVHDVDDGEAHTQVVVASAHNSDMGLGSRSTDADGHWNYTVDNTLIQHLGAGVHASDTFTVTSLDGSASKQVVIDIVGVNDTATIDGTTAGSVTEDDPLHHTASGLLTVGDVDSGENTFLAADNGAHAGLHGSFSFTAATGNWMYTLNDNDAAVQALNSGDTLSDTLTVHSADGTSQDVVVTINGADEPVINLPDPNDHDGTVGNNNATSGPDTLVGTTGADTINALSGNDTIYGNAGDDVIHGQADNDVIYGGSGDDTITGDNGNDTIYAGSGNDNVNGNNGNDIIVGGYGQDVLTGGNDTDTFTFLSTLDSKVVAPDTIVGFQHGTDSFDFSAIDANGTMGGDQAFLYGGNNANVVANSLTWHEGGGNTILTLDTTGDSVADMSVVLLGVGLNLSVTDFHL